MASRRERAIDRRVAEEAAGWVARLQSSDATEQDRREFQIWLQQDRHHQEAYEDLRKLWGDLKDVPVSAGLESLRKRRRPKVGNIIALGLIVALSATLYRLGIIDRLRADYYTGIGQVRSVTLADGTQIDLNTDTAIIVRYSDGERRIKLLRGEAFFSVAKNPERPFISQSDNLRAVARGTRYSMRSASNGYFDDVKVEQGQVEVTGRDDRVVLNANDVASLTTQGRLLATTADVAAETAWRNGKLIFSERPLRDVLAALERYRNGRIIVLDQAAADRSVSGIFDVTDTDQALHALAENLPVRVTRLTGIIIIVQSR